MTSSRRKFPRALKVAILERLESGDSVDEVARSYKVDTNALRRWRREFQESPDSAFPGPGRRPGERGISELQRRIERHAQQIEYLKQRIRSTEAQRAPQDKANANALSMSQHG